MRPDGPLIVPPGKRTGCLPRVSKFGELCTPLADAIEIIPRDQWGDYIGELSLLQQLQMIFDQGPVGSCATESATQANQVVRSYQGLPFEQLNPWFIYHTTSGGHDRGSNIDANLAFARDYGIAPESVWPRSKGWRAKPSDAAWEAALKYRIDEFFDIASVEELGTALLKGFPVVFGWSGHSCVFLELRDKNTAVYANSWGADWGDNGLGTLSLSQVNWGYGAFAVRSTVVDDATPEAK